MAHAHDGRWCAGKPSGRRAAQLVPDRAGGGVDAQRDSCESSEMADRWAWLIERRAFNLPFSCATVS